MLVGFKRFPQYDRVFTTNNNNKIHICKRKGLGKINHSANVSIQHLDGDAVMR
jgi:hypothetical protein